MTSINLNKEQQVPHRNSLEDYIGIGIIVRKGMRGSKNESSVGQNTIEYVNIEKHRHFIESVFSIVDNEDEEPEQSF